MTHPDWKPRMVRFEIAEATVLLNVWQRWNYRKRTQYAQRIAWLVRCAVGNGGRKPMERCHVSIERHSAGLPDWDGLYGGLKALLDCLVVPSPRNPHGLGLIRDDNPECVVSLVARPVRAKRGEGKTVVTIREAA